MKNQIFCTISQILGPRKEMVSVPLKTLRTFRQSNSERFRKYYFVYQISHSSVRLSDYLAI